ncbi:MAG: hypothetical protein J5625_00445 [Lachnospiraceae bacterium]|nr:hypothetical protein [Lachnospiraceae bacterium]
MDKLKIEYEIKERKDIIDKYLSEGTLDRGKAISKIQELRGKDMNVAVVTGATMLFGITSSEEATNERIIEELQMQIDILLAELADEGEDLNE